MTIAVIALTLFAGLCVGLTGIGGVLVVPGLSALEGMPLTRAVPASTLAFLFTGLVATWKLQARRRAAPTPGTAAQDRHTLLILQIAALLGAALGALSLRWVSGTGMHLALAVLALGSGLQSLLGRVVPDTATPRITPSALAGIGLAVGLGSAWSGTGGPILLLPVLMVLAMPTRAAIGMAQAVQLPIALAATAVNWWAGQLDWALGAMLGAVLVIGWLAGDWLAARMPIAQLRRLLGWLLVALGLWYGFHTLS
jgi:uncharacterized membrane protein YfcA